MEGYFKGRVLTEWVKDNKDHRLMRLEEDFVYIDDKGDEWIAPKGSITDGASIPKAFWSILGAPLSGKYRRAAVIHDVYCKNQLVPHEQVHEVFYKAMLTDGVGPRKAKLMYFAVKHFGPKWVCVVE